MASKRPILIADGVIAAADDRGKLGGSVLGKIAGKP